ncbi:MAG TPA: TIGR02594 family protein [Allosphingosinicella sp.]|nr:TIGR02594 family protein [Allosphingosinicella sp.]
MSDPRKPIFDLVRADRKRRGLTLPQPLVDAGDAWLDSCGFPREVAPSEPAWVSAGRLLIGEREIPGPQHNPKIVSWWQRGASWFKDDETPWCGAFVKHCMESAGIAYPKEFPRAAAWATWGVKCTAQVGAVGVKQRTGGNHVFIIIGETPDKRFYKVLHGNSGNMVCIGDIPKADVFAIRWPVGLPQPLLPLPRMAPGTISRNEA